MADSSNNSGSPEARMATNSSSNSKRNTMLAKDWPDAKKLQLVQLYHERQTLWCLKRRNEMSAAAWTELKISAMDEIGASLGESVLIIDGVIRNWRHQFGDAERKVLANPGNPDLTDAENFAWTNLQFLLGNIPKKAGSQMDQGGNAVASCSAAGGTGKSGKRGRATAGAKSRGKKGKTTAVASSPETMSEMQIFLLYLEQNLKKLSPRLREKAQLAIQEVIVECLQAHSDSKGSHVIVLNDDDDDDKSALANGSASARSD